jgi:hypothetical protein
LVCKAVDIDIATVDNSDSRIDARKFAIVWEVVSKKIDDKNFESFPFSNITFFVMRNSDNLFVALHKLIRYHKLLSDVMSPSIREKKGYIVLTLESEMEEISRNVHYTCFFSMVMTLLRHLSAKELFPVEVRFHQGQTGDPLNELVGFFKSRIIFNTGSNEITFQRKDLDSRIRLSDSNLLSHIEITADNELWTEFQGSKIVIPPKSTRIDQREYDWHIYKERHLVECFLLNSKYSAGFQHVMKNWLKSIGRLF